MAVQDFLALANPDPSRFGVNLQFLCMLSLIIAFFMVSEVLPASKRPQRSLTSFLKFQLLDLERLCMSCLSHPLPSDVPRDVGPRSHAPLPSAHALQRDLLSDPQRFPPLGHQPAHICMANSQNCICCYKNLVLRKNIRAVSQSKNIEFESQKQDNC